MLVDIMTANLNCQRWEVRVLTAQRYLDLSRVRSRTDLGKALRALYEHRGLSLAEIEKRSRGSRQELKRSTLSDALSGKTLINPQVLIGVLTVCDVPRGDHGRWLEARSRVAAWRPVIEGRFNEASPLALGIHSAIVTSDSTDDLPAYVERDFDFQLRTALAVNGLGGGYFVILVGGSSTGKTRSLYEAVHDVAPDWRLLQPAATDELFELKDNPPSRTIFWLDELQHFLGSQPPLSSECVRALTRKENIVVGTLWPEYISGAIAMHAATNEGEDVRRLLRSATMISVPDTFTPAELKSARDKGEQDGRIRVALETRDTGLTQALAGGPALVLCWEQAPNPYAKALITVAADAHRLGVQAPLNEDLLTDAMFGYLKTAQRVRSEKEWLARAIPYATRPLHGDVSALSPADGGRAGVLAGYMIADYLAQHLRRRRRTEPVPHEAWMALVKRTDRAVDLRRVADSAAARLRFRYVEPALARLVGEFDDCSAATELAELLIRQDRFEQAVDVLRRQLAVRPRDRDLGERLLRTQELWQRAEEIRPGANAGDPVARERLTEILSDGGVCDDLRVRADDGDTIAAEQLVERLVDRGCLRELRERADLGDQYAAEALADMYLAWGDVDLLQARVSRGDGAAELRLSKVRAEGVRSSGNESEVEKLRAAAGGDPGVARQLCTVLFELRDEDGLRAELEAGTYSAADLLIALYTAQESFPPEQLGRLRAFGLTADGELVTHGSEPMTFGKD